MKPGHTTIDNSVFDHSDAGGSPGGGGGGAPSSGNLDASAQTYWTSWAETTAHIGSPYWDGSGWFVNHYSPNWYQAIAFAPTGGWEVGFRPSRMEVEFSNAYSDFDPYWSVGVLLQTGSNPIGYQGSVSAPGQDNNVGSVELNNTMGTMVASVDLDWNLAPSDLTYLVITDVYGYGQHFTVSRIEFFE